MQICFGCQHSFPEKLMETVDVPEQLASMLESLRAQMAGVLPPTPQGRETLSAMEDTTRHLFTVIRRELETRDQTIRKLEGQLGNVNKEMDEIRRKFTSPLSTLGVPNKIPSSAAATGQKPRPPGSSQSQRNGSMLDRFLQSSNTKPTKPLPASSTSAHHMFSSPRQQTNNTSGMQGGGVSGSVRSTDSVAGAIFSIVEAATVKVRAEIGVLWLLPQRDAGELLGSFVAGSHHSTGGRGTAPYRVSSSSLIGIVANTAISVNLSPAPPAVRAAAAPELATASFSQYLEHNNTAMLLVPIFSRYGEAARTTVGVLQFIGSQKSPMTFGLRNEVTATEAAALLSHIISSYSPSHLQEWMTRMFDSSGLTTQSAYDYTLDMRADEKCFDDFDPIPPLIFRSENNDRTKPKNISVAKALRSDVQQTSSSVGGALETIRDVHRQVKSMEQNWIESVNQVSMLEKKTDQLTAQLDAARQGIQQGSTFPKIASRINIFRTKDTSSPSHKQQGNLQLLDVEDVAADAIRRLKTLPTGSFLNEKGELSTPQRREQMGGRSP